MNRKRTGEIGLEGYFSVDRLCGEIQKLGYDRDDVWKATNYLLDRQLILADNFSLSTVRQEDCVKIQASGFMHLRVLCERLEYLYGVLPVTPIADDTTVSKLADFINRENQRGEAHASDKARAVKLLFQFLQYEVERLRVKNPFFDPKASGAIYVLNSIDSALRRFYKEEVSVPTEQNVLDLSR